MNKQEALEVINDILKDLKYYSKEMGEVLKSANYFIDELEKQVKKEPKPKAYHVKDEYSYDYLIKELVEKGYTKTLGGYLTIKTSYYNLEKETTRNYIYLHDNDRVNFSHELVRDGYEVIEYYKEEPSYYAKRKGWEVFESDFEEYWNYCTANGKLITSTKKGLGTIITKMKKEEWNKLGITDENADFEVVE